MMRKLYGISSKCEVCKNVLNQGLKIMFILMKSICYDFVGRGVSREEMEFDKC